MKRHSMKNTLWVLALWLSCAGALLAQTPPVKPQPIYEQCQTRQPAKSANAALVALNGKETKVRLAAIQQLSRACDSRAVEPLIGLLKGEDSRIRVAAVEALGKLGDPTAVEYLIELVADSDWRLRTTLISALVSFRTFKARNQVLNAMANPNGAEVTDEDDMRVRCAAILTLNQLEDVQYSRKAILFLMGFLASPHKPISKLAEQTMCELKNTRNFPTEMFAILKRDSFFKLRIWAADWLGKLKMESGREVLENAAANDADPRVRQAAAEALKQLPLTK